MLSTIYILLTALGDDEGYLPRVYREAISCVGTFETCRRTPRMSVYRVQWKSSAHGQNDANDLGHCLFLPELRARRQSSRDVSCRGEAVFPPGR